MADLHVILFPVMQYFYLYISNFRIIHFIIIIITITVIVIIIIIIVIFALSALIKFSATGTLSSLRAKPTNVIQVSQYTECPKTYVTNFSWLFPTPN
jgi:uncharacterized membrane protein